MKKRKKILQSKPIEAPAKICDNIEVLSLDKFITCITTNDLSPLIISGQPASNILFKSWMKVLSDYYTLINNTEAKHYITMVSKIEAINTKREHVEALISCLEDRYHIEIIEELSAWGYNYQWNKDDLEKDINKVKGNLANEKVTVARLQLEYEKSQKRAVGEKPTRKAFEDTIFEINSMYKMVYKVSDFTVYSYGCAYNRLREHIRQLNNNNQYGRRR